VTRRPPFDLQGDLRSFGVPLVFQMIGLATATGRLTLRSPRATCEVYFQEGRLVFARGPGESGTLGDELVRRGLLPREQVEAAARQRARRRGGPRLGTLLVDRGLIRRDDLETMIRARIRDAICTCIEWRDGKFSFEAGAEPHEEDILLDVALESLLLECMTRLDDARRVGTTTGGGHA